MHAWATLATEIQSIQRIYCFLLLPLLLLLLTHFPRWLQIIALRYPLGQPTGCIRHRRRRRRHAFSKYLLCLLLLHSRRVGRPAGRERRRFKKTFKIVGRLILLTQMMMQAAHVTDDERNDFVLQSPVLLFESSRISL